MDVNIEPTEVLTSEAANAEVTGSAFKAPKPIAESTVVEAATLLGAAFQGNRRKMLDLQEALTTSDLFRTATGVVLDRETLVRYEEITPVWSQFASRTQVKDFRPKKFTDLFGGRAILDPVPEATEYPARSKDGREYQISVAKRGGRFHITFEDIVNDDLDELRGLPADLAQGARDTEDYVAASLLVGTAGVNADFFKADNGNAVDTKPLTLENLDAALTAISQRRGPDGRLIVNTAAVLVVPPGLATQARRILASSEIRRTEGGVTTVESNYLSGMVRLVVNPWLSFIDSSATAGSSWFLLPDTNARRKALAVAFLRGHENPDLRYRADAGASVGGGALAPESGSFDDDTIQYRVRHILGAAHLDPAATYASKGA